MPNIATMAVIAQQQKVQILAGGTYQKQTCRNRTKVAAANGLLNLSIPIVKRDNGAPLIDNDVKIFYDEMWQKTHWKTLTSAYQSSPFFEFYQDELADVFFKKQEKLSDFNMELLLLFMEWLELETEINVSLEKPILDPRSDLLVSSKKTPPLNFPKYIQVFESKTGFTPNLSIMDLICNLGPESSSYLNNIDLTPILELP
jgi:hypothetical protein